MGFLKGVMVEEWVLLLFYLWLSCRAAYCGMWWKALYWIGGFVLSLAVVKGLNK